MGASAVVRVDERTSTLLSYGASVGHYGASSAKHRERSHELARHRIELVAEPAERKLVGKLPLAALSNLPPNVGDGHAKIVWHLDLHVQLSGCPNVKDTFPLRAGPGGEPFPVAGLSN